MIMNILYCGDRKIEDGLIISVLSLIKNCNQPLNIFVMTAGFSYRGTDYACVRESTVEVLRDRLLQANSESSIEIVNISAVFSEYLPEANMDTRFTPCCMLRLFADMVPQLPEKLLYLDNDVICRKNPEEFYDQDINDIEVAGVLDYYGSWLFRKNFFRRDYINSGVLLLNIKKIRETGLFEACRRKCMEEKMFMPDQTAINTLAKYKKLVARKYNEQRELKKDTVLQHFTTSFRFFPWIRVIAVKPWQIKKMHRILHLSEYDSILSEYEQVRANII